MIAISIFGAIIGALLGFRFTALALIPAALLVAAIAAGYGIATHQPTVVVVIAVLAALVLLQIGFALGALQIYWRKRARGRRSALLRAAQMAIGQEMAKLPLPQEMPLQMLLLLDRLERQKVSSGSLVT